MTDDLNKLTKKELIELVAELLDHVGSLQEKIELLHQDLAVQIHWRMKLEEEINNYGTQRLPIEIRS